MIIEEIVRYAVPGTLLSPELANGNSKEESIQSNFDLKYTFEKGMSSILKARGENKKTNKVRTRERYFVNNQI